MKVLICYKSKGGTTAKYAEWLKEALDADVETFNRVPRKEDFSSYDTMIISSGTYAGFMPLNRFLKRHWKQLSKKQVIVVAVGAAPADDEWSIKSYKRIPEEIRNHIKYFKVLGDMPARFQPKDYKSQVKKENLNGIIEYIKRGT